jgi:hypothetical protein
MTGLSIAETVGSDVIYTTDMLQVDHACDPAQAAVSMIPPR